MTKNLLLLLALLLPLTLHAEKPKLVVALVIDQFRSDNIGRFQKYFIAAKTKTGVGGFNYLIQNGAFYPQGQYDILQPMTGPGHATILSGAYPYLAGIPTNEWYNAKTDKKVYCVEDADTKIIGKFAPKEHLGSSPRNFLASTVGDELKNAGYPSHVVSIALKDRASILMGGHRADIALWMDSSSFTWVSSQFYVKDKLPAWVDELNQTVSQRANQKFVWNKTLPDADFIRTDQIHHEGGYFKAMSEKFPHIMTRGTYSELVSPGGLALTVEAAKKAVEAYHLGANPVASDLLAISFSSHDYVGHAFGPNSRENEEMVIAEDKQLADLFNFLNTNVPGGLKNILFVLTADHGVAPNAEWLTSNRVPAGAVDQDALDQEVEAALTKKFGSPKGGKWIGFSSDFNQWFRQEALDDKKLNRAELEAEAKKVFLKNDAFAFVTSSSDYEAKLFPPGIHERRIKKTYFNNRSGDLLGLPRPFFYVKENTANHMADYNYDETVPILLAGPGIKAGRYPEHAEVVDIAPTLAYLLDIIPPNLSEGRVLSEAMLHNR